MLKSNKSSIGVPVLRIASWILTVAAVGALGASGSYAAVLQTTPTKPKYVAPKPLPRPATRTAPANGTAQGSAQGNGSVRPATPAFRQPLPAAGGVRTEPATPGARQSTITRQPAKTGTRPRSSTSRPERESTVPAERGTPEASRTKINKAPAVEEKPGVHGANVPKETPKNTPISPVHSAPLIRQKDARGRVTSIKTATGAEAHLNPKTGRITSIRKVSPDGTITSVHTSPSGVRNVETIRKDSYGHPVKVVSHGTTGYQERDLLRRPGFKQRTYYENGRSYVRVYQNVSYGRLGSYPVYVPDHYYHPAFYVYAATPFPAPVSFAWGPNPGYAAYGPYFRPAPTYGSPAAFMADFMIGSNLGASAGQQPGMAGPGMGGPGMAGPGMGTPGGMPPGQGGFPSPAGGGMPAGGDGGGAADSAQPEPQTGDPAPIPDEVRKAYVQQVQAQIEAAKSQGSGGEGQPGAAPGSAPGSAPGALDPKIKVFQSYSDVEADVNGQQCALTGGDFVQREEDAPDASGTVAVTVVTIAKPTASHCAEKARVRLSVETLQDWYNSSLEAQQQALAALSAAQGKNGFPPATDVATVANPNGQGTPDDPHALAGALQQQQFDATQIQAEVQPGGGQ